MIDTCIFSFIFGGSFHWLNICLQTFLKSTASDDGRLLHILNRNSRFCVKVPDKFLSHNCTPAWRLEHSCKMFQPTILRNYSRPKNANLRKRIKYTSGIKAAEPDPVSFSMGLLHHGSVNESEAQGFDPVCQSQSILSTCPNPERHESLLESCPLALACPSCWSTQRRESSKNAYGAFYKELQRKLIQQGNSGSYLEYRVLHRYGKIWKKSINAGTAEFRKLVKGLEAKEREKLRAKGEECEMNRQKHGIVQAVRTTGDGNSQQVKSGQVVKIESENENLDVSIDDQEDNGPAVKRRKLDYEEKFMRRLPGKRECDLKVVEVARHRKYLLSW